MRNLISTSAIVKQGGQPTYQSLPHLRGKGVISLLLHAHHMAQLLEGRVETALLGTRSSPAFCSRLGSHGSGFLLGERVGILFAAVVHIICKQEQRMQEGHANWCCTS